MIRHWRFWLAVLCLAVLWAPGRVPTAVHANESQQAQSLLEAMSLEDRIGQLFLITFQGDDLLENSDLVDLIVNYRVGGVMLLAENDNITGYGDPANVPGQLAALTNDLQRLVLMGQAIAAPPNDENDDSLPTETDALTATATPESVSQPIPLFISVSQEGAGYPYDNILSGVTQLPSNMALGAAWQPEFARNSGAIMGRELAAMGVNLLIGPSLDVLENPAPFSPSNLGIRTFGGDPYWVGLMGQAYTTGVHNGSNNRVAVIAKHFPGNGSSDRPVAEEVPTVRKSLEQLKQIELAPFFVATGDSPTAVTAVDGLLTTHIRYQGFQGNIRATTAPVSFDSQALGSLMQLAEFAGWRQNGGVIMSDALGVRAVKRFYDDTGQEFPHRRIARDALQAGNDLLYLSDFALDETDVEAQVANMRDTILWFRERYLTDQLFQQRVDEAALRILQLKLRLYSGDFSPENVLVESERVTAVLNQPHPELFELARMAVTLIAPSPAELAERMASPPGSGEQIIIFTDVLSAPQCSFCPPTPLLTETAVSDRILALYGPNGTGQVAAAQVASFSFADLGEFLDANGETIEFPPVPLEEATVTPADGETPTPAPTSTPSAAFLVQEAMNEPDWIIFAMRGFTENSEALNRFLAERPDIVRNSRIIVLSYDAPYFLDTTEISKLTAYFGIYSYSEPFLDASVRALFLESPLIGAAPVDIEGASYDLFTQTQPDPAQVIPMNFITLSGSLAAPTSEEPREVSVGDTLRLQAGPILDRNGNPVPDGTTVRFIQQDRIQGLVNILAEVTTLSGLAQLDYVLEARTGQFRITAESGEAKRSEEADILIEYAAQVSILVPTPEPTITPTITPSPTPTPTATATASPTPTLTPTPPPPPEPVEPGVQIDLSEFQMLLSLVFGLATVAVMGVTAANRFSISLRRQFGWPLWGLFGSLLVYLYFILELPGTAVLTPLGSWAGLLTTLVGGLIGLGIYGLAASLE